MTPPGQQLAQALMHQTALNIFRAKPANTDTICLLDDDSSDPIDMS